MTHNKDKGTGVGFSKPDEYLQMQKITELNTVCKEHEWVGFVSAYTGNDTEIGICCKNCGMMQPKDFKIKDNLEVIEDNKWDDIWIEYLGSDKFESLSTFYDFVKENYKAPEKK